MTRLYAWNVLHALFTVAKSQRGDFVTAGQVAIIMGRDPQSMGLILSDLARQGLLNKTFYQDKARYRLTSEGVAALKDQPSG